MKKQVLAFDLGASSGRGILGSFDGEKIELTEVNRFDNNPVTLRGTFYWDVLNLLFEIKYGLGAAAKKGEIDSIGIDTWGVDFGLLDGNGQLMQNPVHYRDARTDGLPEEVEAILGKNELYKRTGIQIMNLNTIFQLYSLAKSNPKLLNDADCALLMPDLLGFFLTGEKTAEYSIASTTQMMDPVAKKWDKKILEQLGIPTDLFPEIVPSGKSLGVISEDIQHELGLGAIPVVSIAGHDTASAVVAVPSLEEDFIYISCGTWSLFGTEMKEPVISEKSQKYNITNEGGYGNTTRFLKNIIGLWLIQETRRQYRREGKEYSYNELEKHALASEPFRYFIDPDDAAFVAPGNLPRRICEYCEKTGQGKPETVGAIMRCIYESIAMKYRYAFDMIQECTGKTYNNIHMVGGGTKDNLLCQMTANSTARTIIAGPIEATALGNIAVQLMELGSIKDIHHARQIIRNSFDPVIYTPADVEAWGSAYTRFKNIIE